MPVRVIKRGDQYCVVEPSGKTVKCHPTKGKALAHSRAINANTHKALMDVLHIYKGDDGLRRALLVSSNSFEDRDQEIVSQKALESHVAQFQEGPLLFWHGGMAIGKAIDAEMRSAFLVELATELPNKVIDLAKSGEEPFLVERRHVWDMLEAHRGQWGVSIAFGAEKSDAEDKVFEKIVVVERSILPRKRAANSFTYAAF